jgi:DNA-binding transcriptional ArsR family regulator
MMGGMSAAQLATLASLIADPTRAAFCLALMDGRAWTAGELARHAGVAPATASEHLDKLVAAGLLSEARPGRHRYVRLSGPRAARLIEELSAYGPPPAPARSLRAATAAAAMTRGRTCYDHLAGRLGVALVDALERDGLLATGTGFAMTASGVTWLTDKLGAAVDGPSRRPLARPCLDWTERRDHLAGRAGAAVCTTLLDRRWIARIGTGRAVRVTPAGATALTGLLGPDPAWPEPAAASPP